LKKRTKKLLLLACGKFGAMAGTLGAASKKVKVFWFFSSEKNYFLILLQRPAAARRSDGAPGASATVTLLRPTRV
jgi:hypothetical protein